MLGTFIILTLSILHILKKLNSNVFRTCPITTNWTGGFLSIFPSRLDILWNRYLNPGLCRQILGCWIFWYLAHICTVLSTKTNESSNFDDIHVFQHVLRNNVFGIISDTRSKSSRFQKIHWLWYVSVHHLRC